MCIQMLELRKHKAPTLENLSFQRVCASRVRAAEQDKLSGRHALHCCTKSTASCGVITSHTPDVARTCICNTRRQLFSHSFQLGFAFRVRAGELVWATRLTLLHEVHSLLSHHHTPHSRCCQHLQCMEEAIAMLKFDMYTLH